MALLRPLADYADAVLRDAPLDGGRIEIELVEHVPHLRTLQHLQDAKLDLFDSGTVDDLAFLRDAPPVTTFLMVTARGRSILHHSPAAPR